MQHESQLHVTEWGSGVRVVLVHGGTPGGGAAAFNAQKDLEARWHLVLPDRPGHGLSPRQGREDFERDADLLAPLLEDRSHLVGHSYGAIAALYVAAMRPDAVRSLTLIEPPAYFFAPEHPAVAEMARAIEEVFEHPPADPGEMMNAFFALVGIDTRLPEPLPAGLEGIAEGFTDIRGPHEALIDVKALIRGGYPILVLTSGRIAGFEAIAEAIVEQTGAEHVVVPGTDHAVQDAGELREPVARAILVGRRQCHDARDRVYKTNETIGRHSRPHAVKASKTLTSGSHRLTMLRARLATSFL